ncbi:hypothetical protein PV328_011687 [Microctonus aethiopoides]|uniref:DDE Tnp4 domain-containing protein n=1 Tax=Microctonus aethiopoides TaxID=144406 RepID=A0AA39C4Z2_9HYME|nr:hypothetical protein PV328_011687 [Microctonus aethiopoides]
MKSTWRCLSRHRVLQYEPGFAGRIVNACAVLHNMRNAHGIFNDDPFDELDHDEHIHENYTDDIDLDNNIRGPLAIARRIQDRLIMERFGR